VKYLTDIQSVQNDPARLESLYQAAVKEGRAVEFRADMMECHIADPANLLYAAWYYRFQQAPAEVTAEAPERRINWSLALPLSALTGLILWLLSDPRLQLNLHGGGRLSYITILAAPVVAVMVILFLALAWKRNYRRPALAAAGLALVTAYAVLMAQRGSDPYTALLIPHLAALSLAAVGITLTGVVSASNTRFAFLAKVIEVAVTGGVYLIGVLIFAGITYTLFGALQVQLSDRVQLLLFLGGGGLIPVIAVASAYDPSTSPVEQDFTHGLSKMVAILPRLLLPLTLVVLVIYIFAIPFYFMEPFKNREVLIIYNVMLFAVMGLLVGATPVRPKDLSPRVQSLLRGGILAVTVLVILVSLYALSATVYRTVNDVLTVNRLTIIGWNIVNIAILVLLVYKQLRHGREAWVDSLYATFDYACLAYTAWALFLVLALPWLFRT
jgi:hypothetical protein